MKGCSIVLQESRWKQLMISLRWRFNWESWAAWGHETKSWLTINQRVKGRLSEMRGCNQEIVLIGKVNRAGWRTLIFCFFIELLNSEPQVCCLHLLSVTPLLQEVTLLQKKSVKGLDLMFTCIKNQLFPKDKPDLYKNGMQFIMWHICQSNYRWNLGKSTRILSAEDQRKHLLLYKFGHLFFHLILYIQILLMSMIAIFSGVRTCPLVPPHLLTKPIFQSTHKNIQQGSPRNISL